MTENPLVVTCLGDIAPVKAAYTAIMAAPDEARARHEALFRESDIVFANFETPVSTASAIREDKRYVFKTGADALAAFPEKFVYSIANNHILDYGASGLMDTIAHLTDRGVRFTGAGENLDAARKPVLICVNNRKVGLLAAADPRYQAATADSPGVYPALPDLLSTDICGLRKTADIIYVSIHMGMEFIPVPTPVMIKLADVCHRAGASVVFFHHAHCISGYTLSDKKATLWGTGNFLFPEDHSFPFKPWFDGAAWNLSHSANQPGIRLGISPLRLDDNGLPEKANPDEAAKITGRIEALSARISAGGNLAWLRASHMARPSYIRILARNYTDILRRQGILYVVRQIMSSIRTLFLEK